MAFTKSKDNMLKLKNLLDQNCNKVSVYYNFGYMKDIKEKEYITYFDISETNNLHFDNRVQLKTQNFQISIFTPSKRNLELEENIEKLLDDAEIEYNISQSMYLQDEKMNMTVIEVALVRFREN